MKLEVSIGEAVDKLSILELKLNKIKNIDKLKEIKKEFDSLSECIKYKNLYIFYYNLLFHINEKIWDYTNLIKDIKLQENTFKNFSELSDTIFLYNQKRFRIKNWFNILVNSNLKEQKSYGETYCKIICSDKELIYQKIPEINYLTVEYDIVIFETSICDIINKEFKQPTIIFTDTNNDNLIIINLKEFNLLDEIRNIFMP